MANSYLTPNMNLTVPVVGVDPGPDWANNINASLTVIDGHTHSAGSGVQITPPGININSDLSFNMDNNATNVKTVRFANQISSITPSAPNQGCIYEAGGELYYNDNNSHSVKITNMGSVNAGAGSISGLPSGTASAAYSGASGTFIWQQATNTAANMDVGSLIVRYPGSYPTPSGNAIIIEAPSSLASQYSLTLPALPGQTNVMTLSSVGVISSITYDAVGQNMTSTGANAIANSRTRATGTTVGLGGVAISASCGPFTTTSATFDPVTNLSVTITTSGRPVFVGIISDGSSTDSYISIVNTASTNVIGTWGLFRASTNIAQYIINQIVPANNESVNIPSGCLNVIDNIGAGTYTYTCQIKANVIPATNPVIGLFFSKLIAYEL